MADKNTEQEARMAAKQLFEQMTPEAKSELVNKFKSIVQDRIDGIASMVLSNQKIIDELKIKERAEWDQLIKLTYGPEKNALQTQYNVSDESLRIHERYQLQLENQLQAVKNGGSVVSIIDQYGTTIENIPDFREVKTTDIVWDEETILLNPRPLYIPSINDNMFKDKGFVLDAIRIEKDSYLLSAQSVLDGIRTQSRRSFKLEHEGVLDQLPKLNDTPYVLLTLDQLVLLYDYYYTAAKAKNIQEAEERNQRQRDVWFRFTEERKLSYYNQRYFYSSLPSKVQKKYSSEQWNALTLEEKEKIYIPVKHYGVKRLVSKLDDHHMWTSFHEMYERFIDAQAVIKIDKGTRYAHPDAFSYWSKFREMMDYKIKDIKIQRQDISETYNKAIETSYGESNTDIALKEKYGILVKRQNGSSIKPDEISDIEKGWGLVQSVFGNLKPHALTDGLKVSHSANTYMFAQKAIGVYIPQLHTIGVSKKYGEHQFNSTLSHEVAHWIDNLVGSIRGERWATDNYESTAGIIAFTFRNNMNKPKNLQTDYINATKECFARALQQYFGLKIYGNNATISHSYVELDKVEPISNADTFVRRDTFEEKIQPLIEKFFEENRDIIEIGVDISGSNAIPEIGIAPTIDIVEQIATTNESIPELIEGLEVLATTLSSEEQQEIKDLIEGLKLFSIKKQKKQVNL